MRTNRACGALGMWAATALSCATGVANETLSDAGSMQGADHMSGPADDGSGDGGSSDAGGDGGDFDASADTAGTDTGSLDAGGETAGPDARADTGSSDARGDTGRPDGGGDSASSSAACVLSQRLRRAAGTGGCHFLVGMGNDLANDHNMDGAYTLGTTLDLHYAYLTGLPTQGGWPDWNANGSFVNILADSADAHGVTPMFTLYGMAAKGDGNFAMTTDDTAMNLYWQGAKLVFQRLAVFGKPAVVHLEPDFWGYAMQHSMDGTAQVIVTAHAPDCAGMQDNLIGMAGCLVKLARTYAPQAAIGFHASVWGGTQQQIVQFFKAIHADAADFIAIDMLDRDAGCFEAHTDPNCMRSGSGWYWDESNQTSPNFHDNLTWAKAIHDGLNLPVVWWQIPFGVPSTTPGGTSGHYRDNRVHYMFNHISEYIAAGGVGAAFGTGAGNQTYITTDGNQFRNAVTQYFAAPAPLP
jgi:hypothetical protein